MNCATGPAASQVSGGFLLKLILIAFQEYFNTLMFISQAQVHFESQTADHIVCSTYQSCVCVFFVSADTTDSLLFSDYTIAVSEDQQIKTLCGTTKQEATYVPVYMNNDKQYIENKVFKTLTGSNITYNRLFSFMCIQIYI